MTVLPHPACNTPERKEVQDVSITDKANLCGKCGYRRLSYLNRSALAERHLEGACGNRPLGERHQPLYLSPKVVQPRRSTLSEVSGTVSG